MSIARLGRIAVVDPAPVPVYQPANGQFANRVSSLTPSSVNFIRSIGAWPSVDIGRVRPFNRMMV